MITDYNVAWIRKRLYLNWFDLHAFIIAEINEAGTANFDQGELMQTIRPDIDGGTIEDPTSYITAVSAGAEGEGLAFNLVLNGSVSRFLDGSIPVPYDLNPNFPIGVRINHILPNFPATITYQFNYTFVKRNVVVGTDTPSAARRLNFTAQDNVLNNMDNSWTNRLTFDPRPFINRADVENRAQLMIQLVVTGTLGQYFQGLELDYVPQRCVGQGSNIDCPVTTLGRN